MTERAASIPSAGEEDADLKNTLALAASSILAFLILATGSYINPGKGVAVCAGAIGLAALLDLRVIWVLALFLVPFSQLFAFTASDMQALVSVALIAAALRCLPSILPGLRALPSSRFGYTWIILFFVILVVLHFTFLSAKEIIGAGFLAATFILFRMARRIGKSSPRLFVLTECAMVGGALIAASLSVAFIYIPLPHLVINQPMPDSLRLTGVFDGPNAAAHYLLPSFAFFLTRALLDKPRQIWWITLLIITSLLLAAPETKAAIGAVMLICVLAIALVPRQLRSRAMALSAISLLCMFLWFTQIVLVVEQHAGNGWWQWGDKVMMGYAAPLPPDELTMPQTLKRELRIGVSTEMTFNPVTGKVLYGPTSNSLLHTGQRDYVWRAGLATIREHPLWGIGYKTWQQEMFTRLGYPFRSPHNGFMEVAGAYGVLGAALYIMLAVFLALNLLKVRRCLYASPGNPRLLWVTLVSAALFAAEAVDVSTSLAVTVCAVWFWVFLGLQEGLLRKQPVFPPDRKADDECYG